MPVILVGANGEMHYVNHAAEQFFDMGAGLLTKHCLADLLPFGSPLLQLVQQARERGASLAERNVDLTTPKSGERLADVTLTPAAELAGGVVILLQERSLAQRIDRQLLYRGAARSMSGMAAV
ncbi:MAG: PAS domain-containing protein, partial [Alphaproteobacteria bacterium]